MLPIQSGGASLRTGGRGAVPRHVAIIMDGNGRWAKKRLLPRVAGHRQGIEAVRRTVRAAGDLGIEALTLFAFSSENWRRPASEIGELMGMLKRFILSDIDEIHEAGIRLVVLGDWRMLQGDIVELIEGAIARTANNTRQTLVVALNYGAQDEIVRVARRLAGDAAAGRLDPATIDAAMFEGGLDTQGLPPLDLLIRTSGEKRLSNFLLWQAAYAELLFVDTLWPDFGRDDLAAAVDAFAARERRFGGL
ncbi:isoprenyl transferase [Sphingomonas sanxanigenens]|uniref:isoprenyl transferase n=1 Tax=Sphingomonas sanxanigenens TaxID=397260 RepID=UPI003CCC3B38